MQHGFFCKRQENLDKKSNDPGAQKHVAKQNRNFDHFWTKRPVIQRMFFQEEILYLHRSTCTPAGARLETTNSVHYPDMPCRVPCCTPVCFLRAY